ncbi:MAG TPA: hypothetical protein VGE86_08920, partial [Thermoanaerobaculia bacterium]
IGGAAMQALFGDLALPLPEKDAFPWQVASWAIMAAALTWFAARARIAGWRLAVSLAVLMYGICSFNSLIEARFFGIMTSRQFAGVMTMSALSAVLLGLALVPVVRGMAPASRSDEWTDRVSIGRVAAGSIAYVVVYFAAGIGVFPFVEAFYAQFTMPNGLHVIGMQLFIRGPVFVALMLLLVRISGASRRETILMTGGALSLLGGVAMLIVPNGFIPDFARWPHFVEVVSSNLAYGCFLGWLLTRKLAPSTAPAALSPAGAGS